MIWAERGGGGLSIGSGSRPGGCHSINSERVLGHLMPSLESLAVMAFLDKGQGPGFAGTKRGRGGFRAGAVVGDVLP